MTLFQLQNADRDIEDFVPSFHGLPLGFSKYKKIGDLVLVGTALLADDDGFGDKWGIVEWYNEQFKVAQIDVYLHYDRDIPFDIMKYISFEDKL